MARTIPIPGGTATFRDELTSERQRRPIKRAALAASQAIAKLPAERPDPDSEATVQEMLAALPLSASEADSLLALYDATVISFLESWTLPEPLPTEDSLLDLAPDLYDALVAAAAKLDTRGAVAGETSFDPTPTDDGSPTGP